MANNLVEMIQPEDSDCAFDQPCRFGHRVEDHAVYCHNDKWADSPRKCRRSWYTDGEIKDEDCPGFQPNPDFKGTLNLSSIPEITCTKCKGMKVIKDDSDGVETCDHCMGDGVEPSAISLSQYEQDTLEMGCGHTVRNCARGERYVRITETKNDRNSLANLVKLKLIIIHSMSFTRSNATVFLISLTPKGSAVMRANWVAAKESKGSK